MEIIKTTRGDILNIDPRNVVIVEGFNSRRDFDLESLKDQIKAQGGVLNPISVIPFKDNDGNEKYRLVDGERRVRAMLELLNEGYTDVMRIPAVKVSKVKNDTELLIEQVVRNEGKRFSDYEYAIAFAKLRDVSLFTVTEIAEKIFGNKTKAGYVSQCLALLELPQDIQDKLASGEISANAVRDITKAVKNTDEQVKTVNDAVETAKEKGKKKATSKDIVSENVKVQTDSMAICKGLGLLINYAGKYNSDNNTELEIDLMDIYAQLKEKKTIVEIFENSRKQYADAM